MISLLNLYKDYPSAIGPITALHNINLEVKQGEIFGIIGKSGAGKSTLIRTINLLEKPTKGQVMVNQEDLTTLSPAKLRAARRKIGMIFQHFNLLSSRTVYDNVAIPLKLAGQSQTAIQDAIMPLLELTGLADKKNCYPAELSGGQKQRVGIARALSVKPLVLLCDEATSALDPETTQNILQLLLQVRESLNLTILLITHEMAVIKSVCDRVGILEKGQLIEQNDVGEFFAYPKTETAKRFLLSSLPQELPFTIQQHVLSHASATTHPLLRLWFMPEAATKPVINQLINQFHLRINLLQGNLEYIKQHAMGTLVLAIDGDPHQLQAGLDYLKLAGVITETIGHIPNDIIPFN